MTDPLKDAQQRVEQTWAEQLTAFRKHSGVTYSARETFKAFEGAAVAAKQAARAAQAKVDKLRGDDTIPVESRRRQVREAIEAGKAEVAKQTARMEAARKVLHAELSTAGLPKLDPRREQPAREELRMILDGSPDPVATLLEVAQRDDELAAVAVSTYGESYLLAHRVPQARQAWQQAKDVAAASSVNSADTTRRAIGVARAELSSLDKAHAATNSLTMAALDGAEEVASGL